MKNCIFILLWCIPGFLFSVTPKPDVEKLTETADTYYQAGKVDSALWAIEQALQLAMTEKDTCAMMSCYTSQGVYLRSSGKLTEAIAAFFPVTTKKIYRQSPHYTTTWLRFTWI